MHISKQSSSIINVDLLCCNTCLGVVCSGKYLLVYFGIPISCEILAIVSLIYSSNLMLDLFLSQDI